MVEQKYIGVVSTVNSAIVSILLDPKITTLKREINGKIYYIGQIGTYVLIPMGTLVLIGLVSELKKKDVDVDGARTATDGTDERLRVGQGADDGGGGWAGEHRGRAGGHGVG